MIPLLTPSKFFQILEQIDKEYSISNIDKDVANKILNYYIPKVLNSYKLDSKQALKIEKYLKEKLPLNGGSIDNWIAYVDILSFFQRNEESPNLEAIMFILQSINELTSYITRELHMIPPIFSSVSISTERGLCFQEAYEEYLDLEPYSSTTENEIVELDRLDTSKIPEVKSIIESILKNRNLKLPDETIYIIFSYSEFYISTDADIIFTCEYSKIPREEQETLFSTFNGSYKMIIKNIITQLTNLKSIIDEQLGGSDNFHKLDSLIQSAEKLDSYLEYYSQQNGKSIG
jgi:hypothetical protein